MRILTDGNVFELYCHWNGLVALGENRQVLSLIRAHDGDFFPESVLDYVSAIRAFDASTPDRFNFPLRVDVDITQNCNSNCTFCFSRPYQVLGYRGQSVCAELLKNVIHELGKGGTKTIRFCGGGEPTVHPDFSSLLPVPHEAGLNLCVISNLDVINAKLAALFLEHVDHIRWSVNAATDETRVAVHRPGRRANPLHVSMEHVAIMLRKRQGRKPTVWATFLVMPENYQEVPEAAQRLKEIGVDSLSFRPVFHGLGGGWTTHDLASLADNFEKAAELNDPPNFSVFIPKRGVGDWVPLNPNLYFDHCYSRNVRTVLEATADGLTLQSCGSYRGTGARDRLSVDKSRCFQETWKAAHHGNYALMTAPKACTQCIDVSMNVTLSAIASTLSKYPIATFHRIHLLHHELRELNGGALFSRKGGVPHWAQAAVEEFEKIKHREKSNPAHF